MVRTSKSFFGVLLACRQRNSLLERDAREKEREICKYAWLDAKANEGTSVVSPDRAHTSDHGDDHRNRLASWSPLIWVAWLVGFILLYFLQEHIF
jgi:hypothetical protein